ncbi:MAG: hypothetical protein ACRD4D_08280 [Candidatus Acidiferrales bacterium]
MNEFAPEKKQEKKPQSWEWVVANQELEQLQSRAHRLWAAVIILFIALAGTSVYGYLTLTKHNLQLGALPGVQESMGLLGDRLAAAEASLSQWSVNWEAVEEKLGRLEGRVNSASVSARKQAQELVAQLHERMSTELDDRTRLLETRMERIEGDQELERARLAQLQEQLAAVRRDTGRDLGAISSQVTLNEGRLNELDHEIGQQALRDRVDFEIGTGYTREVAAGVSLHLTDADVSYQRVKGWVWLLPDRKTLWVKQLGIQQPLRFYRKDGSGNGAHELVITRVSKDGAAGYLLLPAGTLAAEQSAEGRDPFKTTGSGAGSASSGRGDD